MRQQLLVATAALSMLGLSACSEGSAESAGPAGSRTYQVGGFTGLEVAGPFDVKVTTGKAVSVSASGPQKLLDETEVVVEGRQAADPPQEEEWLAGMSWSSRDKSVFTVTVAVARRSGDRRVGRHAGRPGVGRTVQGRDRGLGQHAPGRNRGAGARLSIAGSGDDHRRRTGQKRQIRHRRIGRPRRLGLKRHRRRGKDRR